MSRVYIYPFLLLFTSCNVSDSIGGISGLVVISLIIMFGFGTIFFFINKKKRDAQLTLSSYSADVQKMLMKLESKEERINALDQLIVRINNDPKYAKMTDWKNKVLVKTYEHLAKEYYDSNDEKGVVDACSRIIELDPSNGMCYYNRGSIYSNWGQYDNALKDFKDASIVLPEYSSIYNNRGLVLDKLERYDEALEDYNRAIELLPTAITYFNRANLYFEIGKYQEAKSDYSKYLELDPDDKNELTECVIAAIEHLDKKMAENL